MDEPVSQETDTPVNLEASKDDVTNVGPTGSVSSAIRDTTNKLLQQVLVTAPVLRRSLCEFIVTVLFIFLFSRLALTVRKAFPFSLSFR